MTNPFFPFHALGFQCNPFRAVTDSEWIDLAILPDSIPADFVHLQLLGDRGHGKTTALLALAARFSRSAYEHLEVEQDHFTTLLDGLDIFFLDEAQRLNPRERGRFFSTMAQTGLRAALGSHEDFSLSFADRGWPLTTIHLDKAPCSHVDAVIRRRLSYFALNPNRPHATLAPEAIAYLHQTFGADLRMIENVLYEVFEELREIGEIREITTAAIKNHQGRCRQRP